MVPANIMDTLLNLTEQSRRRMLVCVGHDFSQTESEEAREAIEEFNNHRVVLSWAEGLQRGRGR